MSRKLRSDSRVAPVLNEAWALYQSGWSYPMLAEKFLIDGSNFLRGFRRAGLLGRTRIEGVRLGAKAGRFSRLGPQNHSWRGGRILHQKGYVLIKMPGHPRADKRGYVLEHVLVAERMLGRALAPDEVVHHLNHKKPDNRPGNLRVTTRRQHGKDHWLGWSPETRARMLKAAHDGAKRKRSANAELTSENP